MAKKNDEYFIPENSPVAPSKFDTRVRTRFLGHGHLDRDDLNKHLESLPDSSDNADWRPLDQVFGEEEESVADEAPTQSANESASNFAAVNTGEGGQVH